VKNAIQKARAGYYSENDLAHLSPERRNRFFEKKEGGYQISKTIRNAAFLPDKNISQDPPFSRISLSVVVIC